MMRQEEVTWRRQVLEERIATFSARVIRGCGADAGDVARRRWRKCRRLPRRAMMSRDSSCWARWAWARRPCCWGWCGAWPDAGWQSARWCDWSRHGTRFPAGVTVGLQCDAAAAEQELSLVDGALPDLRCAGVRRSGTEKLTRQRKRERVSAHALRSAGRM